MIEGAPILVTVGFTILSAYVDYEHLIDNDFIEDHKARWFLRFTFALALGIVNPWFILAAGFLFWSLFDQTLNALRKKPFWYLGTTAKMDKFFQDKKFLYIASKFTCLIVSLYLFLS